MHRQLTGDIRLKGKGKNMAYACRRLLATVILQMNGVLDIANQLFAIFFNCVYSGYREFAFKTHTFAGALVVMVSSEDNEC